MISRLNYLQGVFIFLSLLFQVLLVREFGVAFFTDLYYFSIGINQFIYLVFSGFFLELFVPVYNDIKAKGGEKDGNKFIGAVFLIVFVLGVIVSGVVFLGAPQIVEIFGRGFDSEKKEIGVTCIRILSFSILFNSLARLIGASLNANLFVSITYAINLVTPLLNLFSLLVFSEKYGILAVIVSTTLASGVMFLIGLYVLIINFGFKISRPRWDHGIQDLIKKSSVARTGTLAYLMHVPIIFNVISYFPNGTLTIYSYAKRILDILFELGNSGVIYVFYIKASNFLSLNKVQELKPYLNLTVRSGAILLVGMVIPSVFLFKDVFGFLFSQRVTPGQIDSMFGIFLALIPFYCTQIWRTPFLFIALALKEGFQVFKVNLVFIIILLGIINLGKEKMDLYIIPFALFGANLFSAMALTNFVNKKVFILNWKYLGIITKVFLFVTPFLVLNTKIPDNYYFYVFLNFGLVLCWIFLTWKETVLVFKYMTKKGEIV